MSSSWGYQVVCLENLKRILIKSVLRSTNERDVVVVEEVAGNFEQAAIDEWVSEMIKHGEKTLTYARALAIMRGDNDVGRQHIKKAFEMSESGLASHLMDLDKKD